MVKRSELESLFYGENADREKVLTLYREFTDIECKLFTAYAELRKKLADKGIANAVTVAAGCTAARACTETDTGNRVNSPPGLRNELDPHLGPAPILHPH